MGSYYYNSLAEGERGATCQEAVAKTARGENFDQSSGQLDCSGQILNKYCIWNEKKLLMNRKYHVYIF